MKADEFKIYSIAFTKWVMHKYPDIELEFLYNWEEKTFDKAYLKGMTD